MGKSPAMTMKLELPAEIEADLLSQAQEKGLSPEAYAAELLWERVREAAKPAGYSADLSPEAWMLEYKAWAHSHDNDTFPILSNEDIGRDSIYD